MNPPGTNSCYINIALQSLFHLPLLREYVAEPVFPNSIDFSKNTYGQLTQEFSILCNDAKQGICDAFDAAQFRAILKTNFDDFNNNEQHDYFQLFSVLIHTFVGETLSNTIEELFYFVIDSTRKCCNLDCNDVNYATEIHQAISLPIQHASHFNSTY